MNRIWKVKPKITKDFQNRFPEINPIVLQLLFNRGLTTQDRIDEFLNPDYGQDIHDPFLFEDMKKAVNRIEQANKLGEKVVIHGDYDADGVSASVLLVETLRKIGIKQENLYIYIPHRNTEGYGLNEETINHLIKSEVDLIITVDCGIANKAEVEIAKKAGLDIIITDHHEVISGLPNALAIINPKVSGEKYPDKYLAGVGVAFKLAQALLFSNKIEEKFIKWLLDLVAIGTVADAVPLLGENRTLVRYGLVVLNKTNRLGLKELVKVADLSFGGLDTHSISFQIAPRLNAAGRIDHANSAYQLLISKNQQAADDLARQLNNTNQQRQQMTDKLTKQAIAQINQTEDRLVLFVRGEEKEWPAGIIGLIAGKIADLYFRPTFVISEKEEGYIGSGRSIHHLDITEILNKAKAYLMKYGGHAQACGFTIKDENNLKKFEKTVTQLVNKKLEKVDLRPQTEIDLKIDLKEIGWSLFEKLEAFQPFGEDNPKPVFLAKQLKIAGLDRVGRDKQHLRLIVSDREENRHKTIAFGFGYKAEQLNVGEMVDLVFSIDINEWNGSRELQFAIIDFKKHGG